MPFMPGMLLRFDVEGASRPIFTRPDTSGKDMVIGRRDPNTEISPDVDLENYAGYRMGVSRRHALMRYHEQSLLLLDLGSCNGTFLNSVRLPANQPHKIRNGDKIRLGQITLRVHFQERR